MHLDEVLIIEPSSFALTHADRDGSTGEGLGCTMTEFIERTLRIDPGIGDRLLADIETYNTFVETWASYESIRFTSQLT